MKFRYSIGVLTAVAALALVGCEEDKKAAEAKDVAKAAAESVKQTSAGVVLVGCAPDAHTRVKVTLSNGGEETVYIRRVWQNDGEVTLALMPLAPDKPYTFKDVSEKEGFYVVNANGVDIGWLGGGCWFQRKQ